MFLQKVVGFEENKDVYSVLFVHDFFWELDHKVVVFVFCSLKMLLWLHEELPFGYAFIHWISVGFCSGTPLETDRFL